MNKIPKNAKPRIIEISIPSATEHANVRAVPNKRISAWTRRSHVETVKKS
jgi:hypothetical protein